MFSLIPLQFTGPSRCRGESDGSGEGLHHGQLFRSSCYTTSFAFTKDPHEYLLLLMKGIGQLLLLPKKVKSENNICFVNCYCVSGARVRATLLLLSVLGRFMV